MRPRVTAATTDVSYLFAFLGVRANRGETVRTPNRLTRHEDIRLA